MNQEETDTRLVCGALTEQIIGAAIEVHRELGPGLLENTYEMCLVHELASRGLACRRQVDLPVLYKGQHVDCGYRIDIVVEGLVAIEAKVVDRIIPVHRAQLITYLRLARLPVGLLINFNVMVLKDGLVRIVNTQPSLRDLRDLRGEMDEAPHA